jgi:uncharacterized delta-60 repeat protein
MTAMPRAALALLLAAVAAAALAAPASAAIPAPSLSVDTAFAPTTGVASYDFTSGTASDVPNGVATDGDRIYAVGEVRDATGDANIGILARHANGTIDTSFSGDGKMVIPIAAGTGRDLGASIVVLPNHRLRILGATDVDPTSATNLDVAIVGLLPDGSPDPSFGPGGTGLVKFPIGTGDDTPNRMVADAAGRLAIAGSTKSGSSDDAFVSLRLPDGSPPPGFGTAGVRVLNRAGGTLNDRAIDLAFRPGGGLVAVLQIATDAATNRYVTALHAFREDTGADDPAFARTGDLVLPVGDPDTVPGAVIAYDGRLYVTGSTKVGADTDAFLARVDAAGGGFESRRFDMRGSAAPDPAQAVTSQGLDLAVAPGATPTLVVVGSLTTSSGTGWAAAAFNTLGGPLAAAGYGDVVLPNPGQGALIGVAPLADDRLAVAGSILNTSSLDTSFGQAKLEVDADKTCDLALTVPRPLELTLHGSASAPIALRIRNNGTKACGGSIAVPARYVLSAGGGTAPLAVAPVPAGGSTDIAARIRHRGRRSPEDTVRLTLTAPADTTQTNNTAAVHVVFPYCDLGLRASKVSGAPTEGARRYRFVLRNRGTSTCRSVGVGVAAGGSRTSGEGPFSLDAGRSATTSILASLRRGGKVGQRRAITFTVRARSEVNRANDRVTLHPRLVRVGDSRVRGAGARSISGSATGGRGRLSRRALAVRSVQVAIHRLGGKRCSWIASKGGRIRALKASRQGCTRKVWLTAAGGRSWRLSLQRSLPRGRYEAFSRAVIGAGFAEGRFSRGDGNLVRFRVG